MIENKPIMERFVWENKLSLEVPRFWSVEQDNELISLFDENNGVGVLQFSIAKRLISLPPSEDEAKAISIEYASAKGWEVRNTLNTFKVFDSVVSEFSVLNYENGQLNYWRVWHLFGKDRMAFFTYNCLATDKSEEEKLCDLIIQSFNWL